MLRIILQFRWVCTLMIRHLIRFVSLIPLAIERSCLKCTGLKLIVQVKIHKEMWSKYLIYYIAWPISIGHCITYMLLITNGHKNLSDKHSKQLLYHSCCGLRFEEQLGWVIVNQGEIKIKKYHQKVQLGGYQLARSLHIIVSGLASDRLETSLNGFFLSRFGYPMTWKVVSPRMS